VREEDAQVRPAVVPKQLRADLRPVRRRAVTIALAAAAFAVAAAATVRRHYEHHLVREEDLQLPPSVDANQLRDDLRPVRRCNVALAAAALVLAV
jgi:hypothetical protein